MSFGKALKKITKALPTAIAGAGAGFLAGGPVGAVIGAGAGGLLSYAEQQAVKEQNKANQQAVEQANAYDKYTWDLANEYNNPVSQMERLKAAGLNPNLVYGSGNVTGNTAGVAHSNGVAEQSVYNQADTLVKVLPIAQQFANLRNTNNQNALLNYQMGQTQAQTDQIRAQIAHTNAETVNLNNFLTGKGRSTYDPVIQKNIKSLWGSLYNPSYDSSKPDSNSNQPSVFNRVWRQLKKNVVSDWKRNFG